jgi:Ca2+-binding EF-hand superfamily protein
MTPESTRHAFDRALRDELAGSELAQFETALENDSALCAEFEAYADSRGGADLRAIDQWLRGAGAEAARQRPLIQPGLAESVAMAAQGRRRGRLIRIAFGAAAIAAAAVVALVVMLPRDGVTPAPAQPTGWPAEQAGIAMLADNARHFEKALEFAPVTGVKLEAGNGSLLRPTLEGLELIEGEVKATLDNAVSYEIRVGDHRVWATGPAQFTASVRADGLFPRMPHQGRRPGLLARFGGMTFELTVEAVLGQATVKAGETQTAIAEGKSQTFRAEDNRKPPKPEEVFKVLDADDSGDLSADEAPERMLKDFDDNKDGKISRVEFVAHWQPPMRRIEEEFRRLDRNDDGRLDAVEVERRMIDDMDDDESGFVEMPEFKKYFKPRPPRDGGPEGRRLPREGGPEGQRPPREGGPDGQRPPREGGPEGQRPPRGPGPREGGPPPPERQPR